MTQHFHTLTCPSCGQRLRVPRKPDAVPETRVQVTCPCSSVLRFTLPVLGEPADAPAGGGLPPAFRDLFRPIAQGTTRCSG